MKEVLLGGSQRPLVSHEGCPKWVQSHELVFHTHWQLRNYGDVRTYLNRTSRNLDRYRVDVETKESPREKGNCVLSGEQHILRNSAILQDIM